MDDEGAFVIRPISLPGLSGEEFDQKKYDLIQQFAQELREKLDLEIRTFHRGGFDYEKCKQLIRSQGITSLMSMVRVKEDVIGVTDVCHRYLLSNMLRDKLKTLSPSNELVIVDGYIFPKNLREDRKGYLDFLADIFSPTISNIKHIRFITCPKYNAHLFSDFKKLLLGMNSQLGVVCRITERIHDRFWFIDRTKGIFIGTSLNGVGKKYALVDYISETDTRQLLTMLVEEGLLD